MVRLSSGVVASGGSRIACCDNEQLGADDGEKPALLCSCFVYGYRPGRPLASAMLPWHGSKPSNPNRPPAGRRYVCQALNQIAAQVAAAPTSQLEAFGVCGKTAIRKTAAGPFG
jgi:hypothetical protein